MLLTYIRAFFGERNMVAGPSHNNFIFRIVKCAVIYSKTIIKSATLENVKIVGANVTQKLSRGRCNAAPNWDSNQFSNLIKS